MLAGVANIILHGSQSRRIGHYGTQLDQKVQGYDMELQAKVVGHETMTAQSITRQTILELLVTVLALASGHIVIITGFR